MSEAAHGPGESRSRSSRKHYGALGRRLDQLTKSLGIPHGEQVVFYSNSLPPNVRRSFLESGNPFATGGDIYVPFLSFRIGAYRHKKTYFRTDDHAYYRAGIELFGDAVQSTALTNALHLNATPLISGLCALAQTSNLLVPSKEA